MNQPLTLCPFCPLLLPGQPDLWNPVGTDISGAPAMIGDVPCCGDCAATVDYAGTQDEVLAELRAQQKGHMNDLKQELTAILTDPQRTSLYSISDLVAMLRERGVELPTERQTAWELVMTEREKIEREAQDEQ